MSIPFVNVRPKSIKLKVLPQFPASVNGRNGIEVAKENGNWFVDLDYSKFLPAIPSAPASAVMLVWDEATNQYRLVPASSGGGGIPEAPIDGTTYGRKDAGWVPAGGGGGGIPEAPVDGNQYARQNAAWATVAPAAGVLLATNNLSDVANAATSFRNIGGLDTSTVISITAAITLTSTAFSRLHLISGTSANYTITLPTPVGVAGALIGFVVNLPASASKLYTLATPAGVIGRQGANFILWAAETVLLRSDGANWQVIDGRPNPFSGELTRVTNQSITAGAGVYQEVVFTAGAVDPSGLNLCFDSVNGRFVAPRAGGYTFWYYFFGTQATGTYFQGQLVDGGGVGLGGVMNNLGTANNATVFCYGKAAPAAGGQVKLNVRCDGTSALVAGATLPARLTYTESPQW